MRIAVQASDLDHARIDGTRVYLKELLKRFGNLAPEQDFLLYHKNTFNPLLAPPQFSNYREESVASPFSWMQTRFAWEMFRTRPEKLFLPIQAAPFFLPSKTEVTATIHDLAFKKYPETFPRKDVMKLNLMLDAAVRQADKLIAVSHSTKADLLQYYPTLSADKITVVHHGFDQAFFAEKVSRDALEVMLQKQGLKPGEYVLYVGALQPRKNLVRLIAAFEKAKEMQPKMKLVLVGESAWLADGIHAAYEQSAFKSDIHLIGRVDFDELRTWYQGARLFAFPSLYEGFGLPILEAFASGVPVLTADNSSLPEVAGKAALYCQAEIVENIAEQLARLWGDTELQETLKKRAQEELERFSWEKCAQETLGVILK